MGSQEPAPLSLTEWTVLGLIAEQPRHGFAVARELAPNGPLGRIWTVRRPLVYRAVDRLRGDGLVEPTRTEPGDQGPDRTVLRVTRRGRARLRRWLREPVAHPRDVRTELLVKLALLARADATLVPLARDQLDAFAPAFEALARRRATDPAERIVELWRFESSQAVMRLLETLIADVTT